MKKAMTMLVLLTAVLWLGTAFAGDTKEYHNFMALPISELSPEQVHASLEEQDLLIALPYDMEGINVCGYPFQLAIQGVDKVASIDLLNTDSMWVKEDEFQEASQALIEQFVNIDELLTARYGTPKRYATHKEGTVEMWTIDILTTHLDENGSYMAYSVWGNVYMRLWLDSKHFQRMGTWDALRAQLSLQYYYQ